MSDFKPNKSSKAEAVELPLKKDSDNKNKSSTSQEADINVVMPGSLQNRIVIYMHEYCDMFDDGFSIQKLNYLIEKNKQLVNDISETEHLGFTPKFPFKTHEAILEELKDNQKHLIDALRYEESLLRKPKI